jgi:hypothetical protein
VSVEQPPQSSDPKQRDAERQERRRLINQTFRAGDLERCLHAVVDGLADEPDEPHLLKALAVVQNRFIGEIISPLVEEGKIAEAMTSVTTLEGYGGLTPEASASLRSLKSRIARARARRSEPPSSAREPRVDSAPEDELDVSEKALRKAERAWAEGRKKEAKQLLKALSLLPLDDSDLVLRRDGLQRLVDHDEKVISATTERHVTAWRWALVLMLILSLAVVATFVVREGGFLGIALRKIVTVAERRHAISVDETAPLSRTGWVTVETRGIAGDVRDPTGLVKGSLGELISVPVGAIELSIEAEGFIDTMLSITVAADETLVVPLRLQTLPPLDGHMSFRTDPSGATILVNGSEQAEATPLGPVSLHPDRYQIRFEMVGRVPQIREAVVTPGETTLVEASLPEWHQYGRFQLNSRPWSYVFVNGDSIGPTPLTTGELLTDVDHELIFRTGTGLVIRKMMKLQPARAEPTPLTVEFPKPGRLAIATIDSVTGTPVSARVLINGRFMGNSFEEFELSPGIITLRFEKPGYSPAESTVTISAGSRMELTLTLVPEGS